MNLTAQTRERVTTVAFMFAVTWVVISAVSAAHLLTRSRIQINESLHLKSALLKAAAIPLPATPAEIIALFNQRIQEDTEGVTGAYRVSEAAGTGAPARVFLETGTGLWGPIVMAVGFDGVGGRVTGVEVVDQTETPGLGARISEAGFRAQFRGKLGPFSLASGGTGEKEDAMDAITGATITSTAVRDILNRCVARAARPAQSERR
jgi:Na+-transporting NADH:ubiquinone oxidoreductase subunit C